VPNKKRRITTRIWVMAYRKNIADILEVVEVSTTPVKSVRGKTKRRRRRRRGKEVV